MEAISNYSNAIKYDPHNYLAYFKRAKIYELRGETRMAMDDYLTTTKINPKFYDAWFCHGMNYYKNRFVSFFLFVFKKNLLINYKINVLFLTVIGTMQSSILQNL